MSVQRRYRMTINTVQKVNDHYTNKLDTYKVTYKDGRIVSVPLDPDNIDFQEILEWEKVDGNTIKDAE